MHAAANELAKRNWRPTASYPNGGAADGSLPVAGGQHCFALPDTAAPSPLLLFAMPLPLPLRLSVIGGFVILAGAVVVVMNNTERLSDA
jgi:hypothetical protein